MTQRWTKGGLLAEPTDSAPWLRSHLAVPTVWRRSDGSLDVYVSSRDADDRSHICRLRVSSDWPDDRTVGPPELVLGPGDPGAFDDSGAMASCVREVDGVLELWYVGWNRGVTVPFRNAVGVAVSRDGGLTFERPRGPALDRSPVDPCFVASCFVSNDDGRDRMWYTSGVRWDGESTPAQPHYHIKYATSTDGASWRRDGLVCIDFASPAEHAITRPWVLTEGEVFRMWYSHRGRSYRIGYAESGDGVTWARMDAAVGLDVSSSGWDSEMVAYPCVFDHHGGRFMLYNGNGYGRTGVGWAVLE